MTAGLPIGFILGFITGVFTCLFFRNKKFRSDKIVSIVVIFLWIIFHTIAFFTDREVAGVFDIVGAGSTGHLVGVDIIEALIKIKRK